MELFTLAPHTHHLHCVFINTNGETEKSTSSWTILIPTTTRAKIFCWKLFSAQVPHQAHCLLALVLLPACPHWGQNQSTPPNGLFALKICRSNPKPGHEINPMALYAHYKAFCCVMISLARPAAYIIVPNLFFTSRGRENSFYWETRGAFFAAIVGEQIARLAREQQKWALSRHPWPCHFFLTLVSHLDCVHIKVLSLAAA